MVDISISPQEALKDAPPAGSEILYGFKDDTPWLVLKESLLDGDDLSDAAPTYDSRAHDPVVSFRFNARGQRRFAHATEENVGKPFAIVLDDKVLSAPVIREPITGGQGQISGNFTVQEASSVAGRLVAAALPGRLTLVEQKLAEPGTASRQAALHCPEWPRNHSRRSGGRSAGFVLWVTTAVFPPLLR